MKTLKIYKMNGIIQVSDHIFPIFGGEVEENQKNFEPKQLIGTAFCIGSNLFITAGHVISQAKEYSNAVLGVYLEINSQHNAEELRYIDIEDFEIFEKLDVALFSLKHNVKTMGFYISPQQYYSLDEIYAVGFPFGLDENGIYRRAFKGHIVSSLKKFVKGDINAQCYELSIHCPRGISGAPLLYNNGSDLLVIGIIIGNRSSEIEIYHNEELFDNGKIKIHERRMETTKFGLAIKISELFEIDSRMLGSKFLNHFEKGLLYGVQKH